MKRFGANRAAWVALQTKPMNWSDPPPASDDALQFPKFDVAKPDSWTEAPHSRVMPDRFVLMLFRGGKAVHTIVGNQVDDIVVVGPAPLDDDGKSTLKRDPATGRLVLGDEFSWIADFPLAIEKGLGFRVALNADEASGGFDQLLVIGLKLSANETDTQQLIEELIQNHHYSAKGFALVRQGTPTNNTDNDSSGFGATDPQAEQSFFVETGPPLFAFEANADKATDGQRFAEYLGVDYEALAHIAGADATDHAEAIAMNKALYAGTLGLLPQHAAQRRDEQRHARARALALQRIRHRSRTVTSGPRRQSAIRFFAYECVSAMELRRICGSVFSGSKKTCGACSPSCRREWVTLKPQLPHIGKDTDANANLIKVLGLQPTSADYYQRVGYSYDYLRNEQQFAFGGRYFGDVIGMSFERNLARAFLATFGYDPTNKPVPLLLQLIWRHYQTRLDRENLIDGLPLSETQNIKPYEAATGRNYIDWLLENADDVEKLEAEDFGAGIASPQFASLFDVALRAAARNHAHHFQLARDRRHLGAGTGAEPQVHEHQHAAGRVALGSLPRAGQSRVA